MKAIAADLATLARGLGSSPKCARTWARDVVGPFGRSLTATGMDFLSNDILLEINAGPSVGFGRFGIETLYVEFLIALSEWPRRALRRLPRRGTAQLKELLTGWVCCSPHENLMLFEAWRHPYAVTHRTSELCANPPCERKSLTGQAGLYELMTSPLDRPAIAANPNDVKDGACATGVRYRC